MENPPTQVKINGFLTERTPGKEFAGITSRVRLLLVFCAWLLVSWQKSMVLFTPQRSEGVGANHKWSAPWMWIKHFTVVSPTCALKIPLGSELQKPAFSKALIQNRHRWQLYYFCTFRCTHICFYLPQLNMPICCNY